MRASRNVLEHKAGWGAAAPDELLIAPDSCWALRRGREYAFVPHKGGLRCVHASNAGETGPYLCVPMAAQGEILGLLHLQYPQQGDNGEARLISDAEIQLATNFADRAALALANLKLHETLKQRSVRDPLITLYNRRALEEALERVAVACRAQTCAARSHHTRHRSFQALQRHLRSRCRRRGTAERRDTAEGSGSHQRYRVPLRQ
jgi:GAF domain-containing protein